MAGGSPISIVLAGGRASRMGGEPKTRLPIAGVSSLGRVLAACPGGLRVVVGPTDEGMRPDVLFVQEYPPFGGPVAALAAGLAAAAARDDQDILVLAGDMPYLRTRTLRTLLDGPAGTVRCARDEGGRVQYLCSCWPASALRRALDATGARPGASMRQMFATLPADQPVLIAVDPAELADVDTPEDMRRAEWQFSNPEVSGE